MVRKVRRNPECGPRVLEGSEGLGNYYSGGCEAVPPDPIHLPSRAHDDPDSRKGKAVYPPS